MRTSKTSFGDNPCWGGPEPHQHDLLALLWVLGSTTATCGAVTSNAHNSTALSSESHDHLALIERVKQQLILYKDDNYLAIHKPADVRMDGPHRATIHKLLLYLFPPTSLQNQKTIPNNNQEGRNNNNSDRTEEPTDIIEPIARHEHLLQAIAPLSKRNDLSDDPFRNIHQLDYATSGVLLVGNTKKGTGVASQAFEHRKMNKVYVAVVINNNQSSADKPSPSNDVPPLGSDFFDKLPIIPNSSLDSWRDGSLEKQYRKKRNQTENSFDGYMPISSVFEKWRASLMRAKNERDAGSTDGNVTKRKKQKRDYLPPLPKPSVDLSDKEIDELLLAGPSYKKVKLYCAKKENDNNWTRQLVSVVQSMAKEYNEMLAEYYAKQKQPEGSDVDAGTAKNKAADLPPLFRIENDGSGESASEFYICASIGELKDMFRVVVDPAVSNQSPLSSSPLPELRPSLTKCTLLWRGYTANGHIPIAKVQLKPWTGRRHQLRVHLAHVAGMPILGDVAYGRHVDADGNANERGGECQRMCLHAKELTIPLLRLGTKTFVAEDPFVITSNEDREESLVIL